MRSSGAARRSGGGAPGRRGSGGKPQVGEDLLYHGGLGDEGDHAPPSSAVLADEDIDLEYLALMSLA